MLDRFSAAPDYYSTCTYAWMPCLAWILAALTAWLLVTNSYVSAPVISGLRYREIERRSMRCILPDDIMKGTQSMIVPRVNNVGTQRLIQTQLEEIQQWTRSNEEENEEGG